MNYSLFDETKVALDEDIAQWLPTAGSSVEVLACHALVKSLPKKFVGDTMSSVYDDEARRNSARTRFLNRNTECGRHNAVLKQGWSHLCDDHQVILGESRRFLARRLARLDEAMADPSVIADRLSVGPGASQGSEFNDLYAKAFDGKLLAQSDRCLYLWMTSMEQANMAYAESIRRSNHGEPMTTGRAKWTSVPKSNETDRSIVIPTTVGSMVARSIGLHLEDELQRYGLDIAHQQDANRELARLGSLASEDDDMRLCTIDLSDASDSLYYELICYLFGDLPNLLKGMLFARDEFITVEGDEVKLEIFSTMGCGFTFPLQTWVFYAFAYTVAFQCGLADRFCDARSKHTKIGVFGDDIIVPYVAYHELISFMLCIGLVPNPTKSYCTGQFRESCGSDWFAGYNVRGVYCQSLDTPHDVVSLYNRLHFWSSQWRIPLTRTLQVLMKAIPSRLRNPVPPYEDSHAGLWSPDPPSTSAHLSRLYGRGVALYQPWVAKPSKRSVSIGGLGIEWSAYDEDWVAGTGKVPKVKRFNVRNTAGYIQCVLGGAVSGHTAGLRSNNPQYSQGRWVVSLNWLVPPAQLKTEHGQIWLDATSGLRPNLCLPGLPEGWTSRMRKFATPVSVPVNQP